MIKLIKCAGALLLTACMGLTSYGKAVDENTAKTIGYNFLSSTYSNLVKSPSDLVTSYTATAQANFGIVTDYYVFNVQGGIGFVMVSGDDNVRPILAYSNESSFDFDKMSPSAKDWVEWYQNQITYIIANKVPAIDGVAEMWSNLMEAKRNNASAAKTTGAFPSSTVHLLKTTWDQAPGYNSQCPGGGTTYTGCVATSTAQVMKFWNWPTVGSGYHTYTHPSYGALKADFSNTAYSWSAMSLTSGNTQVATLMYQVGVAVNMNYSTTSSGAYTDEQESPIVNCSEFALKAYFHYKRSLHGITRYNPAIATATWIKMLKDDLDLGHPILYSGTGPSGGHAWVCDGYDASSNFHMNWGWSGTGPDGYYSVDNLNPPALGIGGGTGAFNNYQAVILGIQPDSFPTTPAGTALQLTAHLDCGTAPNPSVFNSPSTYVVPAFSITTQIGNTGSSAFSGDFSAQIFDSSMNYFATMETKTGQNITAAGTTPSLSFAFTGSVYQMIPGYYHVRIMYRPTGTSAWTPVANNATFINDNILVVGNTQTIELVQNTVVTVTGSSTPTTTLFKGKTASVASKVGNYTTNNFNGSLRAVLTDVTSGTQTVISTLTGQTIFSSGSLNCNFGSLITCPTGTYTLAVQHQTGGVGAWTYTGSDAYENPIIVTVINGVGVNTPSSASEKISVFPNPSKDFINIKMDGVEVNRITITDILGHLVQNLATDNTQSVMTLPVSSYAAGIYFVNLYTGSEVVTKKIVITK